MKTSQDIENLISREYAGLKEAEKKKTSTKQLNGIKRKFSERVKFLRTCRNYLESTPPPEVVQKHRDDLKKKIEIHKRRAVEYSKVNDLLPSTGEKKYFQLVDMKLIKAQLKTLEFILSKDE